MNEPRFTSPGTIDRRLKSQPTFDQRKLAPIDRLKSESVDPIADHQHISNALSTAQWHLANGRINEATGRIVSAARQLKQACTDFQGRA